MHEYDLAEDSVRGPAGAARGRVRALPRRTARAAASHSCRTGARARSTTSPRGSSASAATPTATGCRRCWAATWSASTSSSRSASPGGDMAFRGLFFTEEHEHLDVFAVDLHETGPSGGDVHWRGAATRREPRELRGPDPDRPRRAADPHLPADPLDDALAEGADRRDPVGARVRRRRLGLARRHRRRARRDGDLLHADPRPGPRRRRCA